jgi:hypothetical protein
MAAISIHVSAGCRVRPEKHLNCRQGEARFQFQNGQLSCLGDLQADVANTPPSNPPN